MPDYVYEFIDEWVKKYYPDAQKMTREALVCFLGYIYRDGETFLEITGHQLDTLTPTTDLPELHWMWESENYFPFIVKMHRKYEVDIVTPEIKQLPRTLRDILAPIVAKYPDEKGDKNE